MVAKDRLFHGEWRVWLSVHCPEVSERQEVAGLDRVLDTSAPGGNSTDGGNR
jgi:hypothetical protein